MHDFVIVCFSKLTGHFNYIMYSIEVRIPQCW